MLVHRNAEHKLLSAFRVSLAKRGTVGAGNVEARERYLRINYTRGRRSTHECSILSALQSVIPRRQHLFRADCLKIGSTVHNCIVHDTQLCTLPNIHIHCRLE